MTDRSQRRCGWELLHGDAKPIRQCYANQGEARRVIGRFARCATRPTVQTEHDPNHHTLRPVATDETMHHGATW